MPGFKLTHRDMGPRSRYLGSQVPEQEFIWQDPLPKLDHPVIEADEIKDLKTKVAKSGLSIPSLVKRHGLQLQPSVIPTHEAEPTAHVFGCCEQKNWVANDPVETANVISTLDKIAQDFNQTQSDGKKASVCDLIVLGGSVAIEQAAKRGGQDIEVGFVPGRVDANQEQTDIQSFGVLEPTADGFKNYFAATTRNPPQSYW